MRSITSTVAALVIFPSVCSAEVGYMEGCETTDKVSRIPQPAADNVIEIVTPYRDTAVARLAASEVKSGEIEQIPDGGWAITSFSNDTCHTIHWMGSDNPDLSLFYSADLKNAYIDTLRLENDIDNVIYVHIPVRFSDIDPLSFIRIIYEVSDDGDSAELVTNPDENKKSPQLSVDIDQVESSKTNIIKSRLVAPYVSRLTFSRSYNEARPFEQDALNVLNQYLKKEGKTQLPREGDPLHLSSIFLGSEGSERALTVFFRSASIGGSGATHSYYAAIPKPEVLGASYTIGFSDETNESGNVYTSDIGGMLDVITVTTDSNLPNEYLPVGTEYELNPAE